MKTAAPIRIELPESVQGKPIVILALVFHGPIVISGVFTTTRAAQEWCRCQAGEHAVLCQQVPDHPEALIPCH